MDPRIHALLLTANGCALRLVVYPPGARQRPHAHATDSLTLVVRGELLELDGSGRERASTLSVVAKPAGFSHANEFGPAGATTLQIEFPADDPTLALDAFRPAAARWDHAGPACRPLLELLPLLRASSGTSASDRDRAEELVGEALGALSPAAPAPRAAPAWLREVRAALIEESASVADLARRAGVHPVYLARKFRECFGISPRAHRARMRLARAAQGIAVARAPLADVALDAGYCDQPHMSHEVRLATGLTPRALRRLVSACDLSPA